MLRYADIIEQLNIDEKLAILTDANFLASLSAEKEGVPYMSMARLEDFNQAEGYLRYPSFEALANAWDVKATSEVAKGLAVRAREAGVNTALLPKSNLRSNLFLDGATEDPYLMGMLTSASMEGSESVGVKPVLTTCAIRKEDCEYADSQPNAKAIMEYYLRPFLVATQGKSNVAITTSYERLQGEYEKVNIEFVKSLLEKQIAGKGNFFISEKTSTATAVHSFNAGYSLTLKGRAGALKEAVNYYQSISEAIESGVATAETLETALREGYALSPESIDEGVDAVLSYAFGAEKQAKLGKGAYNSFVMGQKQARMMENAFDPSAPTCGISREEMLAFAEKTAVLLKNDFGTLPLKAHQRVAVVGALGESAVEYVKRLSDGGFVGYAAGYDLQRPRSDELVEEAEEVADRADTVLMFVGFGEEREKKLSATKCLQLPGTQMLLVDRMAELGKRIVVVVMGSGRVDMAFDEVADAVLYAPDMGSCMGEAVAKLLYGESNPSGKLAFTMYDAPEAHAKKEKFYKNKGYNKVGMFVGYRRYVSDEEFVKYPFGYGLSYTKFRYEKMHLTGDGVALTIKNVGKCAGEEIVQFYYENPESDIPRPAVELLDFERVYLKPGQSTTIYKSIRNGRFAVYDADSGQWVTEKGLYRICAASSADEERLSCNYYVIGLTLPNKNEQLSDYLQSNSNIVSGGYFMDTNIKRIQQKSTPLVLGIIAILLAALYDVFAFMISPEIEFFVGEIGQVVNLVLFIIFNLLAIIGLIGMIAWGSRRRRLKKEEAASRLAREEDAKEKTAVPVAYTRLFIEEFGEEAEEIVVEEEDDEEEEKEISFAIQEETDGYHKDGWTFTDMHQELIAFAAEYGVLIDATQARTLLSAMNVSRLVVLKFDKDANRERFLEMLSAFFGVQYYADNTEGYATLDDLFFYREEDQGEVYAPTNFTRAFEEATADRFAMKVAHLTSVGLSSVTGYFTQMMRYVVKPETPYNISFKNKAITEKVFTLSPNLWIFMTLSEGEMVDKLPAYIAETAALINVKYVEQVAAEIQPQREPVSFAQFLKFGDKARNGFELEENKWKYVDKLEEYVKARADYRLSNKMWQKMERYASCYLALGGEPANALDSVLAVKMLATILGLIKHNKKEGDDQFARVIDNMFGDEDMDACRKVIDASAVDVEEVWMPEETTKREENIVVEEEKPAEAEEKPVEAEEEKPAEAEEEKPVEKKKAKSTAKKTTKSAKKAEKETVGEEISAEEVEKVDEIEEIVPTEEASADEEDKVEEADKADEVATTESEA